MTQASLLPVSDEIEEILIRPPAQPPLGHDFEGFYSRYGAYRHRMSFGTSDPRSRCDIYGIDQGLLMLVVDVGLTRTFESRLEGQDIVEFHYRANGSIALGGRWGQIELRDQLLLLWYQPPGCSDVEEVIGSRAAPHESWISLYCDRQWLYRTLGPQDFALLDALTGGEEQAPRYKVYPQLGATRVICADIIRTRYDGPIDYLYFKGKGLELLSATVRALRAAEPQHAAKSRLTAQDRRKMSEARAILEKEFVAPPDVPTLARRVGTNSTKLCFGFKAQFDETISEFVRRRRLELARALLRTSDLQVRQIAWRVGYQHHSTFTAAFARYFGVVPKAIQRESRAPGA